MFFELERARIFFDTVGPQLERTAQGVRERPTLIALHGGPGYDHTTLRPWFDRFADTHQVLYIDHRGNGRSTGDFADMHLERWAADIKDICDRLGIVKPVVMGQSFGGMVAMRYAADYPEHPAKVILSSTAPRLLLEESMAMFARLGASPEALDVARRNLTEPDEAVSTRYAELCLPLYNKSAALTSGMPERRTPVTLHFFRNEFRTMDLRSHVARIEAPTLVLAGGLDPITPVACARELAGAIGPNARLEEFPHCGHGVYRDDPEGAERVLRKFLAA
ncbi:alpha/beta fold hydrolase [Tsuneonella sp. HG222]